MNAYPVYINVNLFIIKSRILFYGIYQSKYPYIGIVIKWTVCLKQGTILCFYTHFQVCYCTEALLFHHKITLVRKLCNENMKDFYTVLNKQTAVLYWTLFLSAISFYIQILWRNSKLSWYKMWQTNQIQETIGYKFLSLSYSSGKFSVS